MFNLADGDDDFVTNV